MAHDLFASVAICGYSCRLPGSATNPENLWKMCEEGRSAWSEIPKERFAQEAFYHSHQGEPGTTTVHGGHFLQDDVYAFDTAFFNMSIETAMSMDPAVRLELESVFEAFEHGGMALGKVAGSRCSVYSASFHRDYHDSLTRNPDELPRYFLTGNGTAMLSNRISHFFDLRGPSMTLDTGCSSSLTALHTACRSLQANDCEMSIVTGCNLMLNPDPFISMSGVGLLSQSGRSYAFDTRAEGYGRGEGVVTLVLKTLSQAKHDGDTIHAVIRGSAFNQDGKTTTITSPSQEAQEALVRECYAKAGLDPCQTPFVECHGTGTQVGDVCEVSAIRNAFRTDTRCGNPLYLGSVKSNIGHLEAASGLASIIKVIKAFQHNMIPPNYDFLHPNNSIKWVDWRLTVPQNAIPWPPECPKRASVNSFGYGGANAHIILDAPDSMTLDTNEQYINGDGQVQKNKHGRLFLLSSNDDISLTAAKSKLREFVQSSLSETIDKQTAIFELLSYTLACRRTQFKFRTAVQASSGTELACALASTEAVSTRGSANASIGFVFTGQGAHWAGMGVELIDSYVAFRETLERLDEYLAELGASWSIIEELRRDLSTSRLEQAEFSMPICCALQIALVVLLRSWNIVPSAVTGHSSGESAAAFATGALDMRSAFAIQYYRGLLTAVASGQAAGVPGGMLAVGLDPEEAQRHIDNVASGRVVIGCFNSPCSVTISGDETGIIELEQLMREKNIFARRLRVQNAFHSHHMDRDALEYRQLLESSISTTGRRMSVPLASSVTGTWITKSEDFSPEHWVKYMLQPVQFTDAVKRLCTEKVTGETNVTTQKAVDIIVEIGPHSALASALRQTMKTLNIADVAYTSMLKRSECALTSAHNLVGFLWSRGCDVDFHTIIPRPQPKMPIIDFPSYSWNHEAHFAIRHPTETAFRQRSHAKSELIGTSQPCSNPTGPSWAKSCSISAEFWPYELTIDGITMSPQPLLISMVVEASKQLATRLLRTEDKDHPPILSFQNINFDLAAQLPANRATAVLRTSLYELPQSVKSAGFIRAFQVHCIQETNQWSLLCQGQVSLVVDPSEFPVLNTGSIVNETVLDPDGIALRRGTIHESAGRDVYIDDDVPPTHSVQIHISPQSAGLSVRGTLAGGDASLTELSIWPERMASAFQVAVALNHIQHPAIGITKVPASIEKLMIGPQASSESSTSYNSNARRDEDNTISVAWSQPTRTEGLTEPYSPIQGLHIQGIRFGDPQVSHERSKATSQIHVSCLRHSLVNVSNEAIDEVPRHALDEGEKRILLDLKALCQQYFYQTLTALRNNPPRRFLGHFASYVQFMKSVEAASRFECQRMSDEDAVALRDRVRSSSVNGLLVCTVGDQLVPLLRGEVDPLEVMLKDRLLHRYYEEGLRWTRSYQQLQAIVKSLSCEHPRMEVLEIGAGTGGATASVLEALEAGELCAQDIRCASYTYTDISAGFFPKAREKFRRYENVMSFKKLDIEKDAEVQSFPCQAYDLIIASQCLHATSNMKKTMANVRKLLKPQGRLVMVETTKDALDIQLFASCFRGWWLSEEPERKWSPSLSIDLWRKTLIDTGFSGIDFTVRDCEDRDLYAMQVILSTALPGTDKTSPDPCQFDIILSNELKDFPGLDALQEQLRALCTSQAIAVQDPGIEVDSSIDRYLIAIGNDWGATDMEKLTNAVQRSRGTLLITSTDPSNGSPRKKYREVQQGLNSFHANGPISSLQVDSGVRKWDQKTLLAIANVYKTFISGKSSGQPDREYHLISGKLYVPLTAAFGQPLDESRDVQHLGATGSLKPAEWYFIRGRSVGLVLAACRLFASLGSKNILTSPMSPDDWNESDLDVLRSFANILLSKTGCQITPFALGAHPKLGWKVAGIVDFGDIEENIDLRIVSKRATQSTMDDPLVTGSTIMNEVDFNISFAPLYDLLPVHGPSKVMGTTTVYTGSIATTDEFAREVRCQGAQPVEMHTVLLLLAELVGQPKPLMRGTFYIGLTTSLYPEERKELFERPQFRNLSPRAIDEEGPLQEFNARGRARSQFQVLPSMSEQEKLDTICAGTVGFIADIFMTSASEVNEDAPLTQFIDSLTAVQLRGWLLTTFRVDLTVEDISKCVSIRTLAERIVMELRPQG